ncbi:hypothetical protein Hanom_Chr17g01577601 [Helianthus anomalus]
MLMRKLKTPTAQHIGPINTEMVKSTTRESAGGVHTKVHVKDTTTGGGSSGGSGATPRKYNSRKKKPRSLSPIRAEDTLGDIYYKTYDESHANELHAPMWNLKQSDTFSKFRACREGMMRAFPHVKCDIRKTTNMIIYIDHISMTMPMLLLLATRLRDNGIQYTLRALARKNIANEKAAFEKEKKSEEWGLQGLKLKLQASEDTLAEERRKWCVACENDNKKMYAAHTKITNLEAHVEELKKYEVDLSAQIISKDSDLAGKDAEIAELKRRLREEQDGLDAGKQKNESLEIDLTVEKVKAETAEKVRKVSLVALNVA